MRINRSRRNLLKGFIAGSAGLLIPERFVRATPSQQLLLGGGAPTTDPYWSSVSLLLHQNTSAVDVESSHSSAVTKSGGIAGSTTQVKFGAYSAQFVRASGMGQQLGTSALYQWGTGDLTAECWIYDTLVGSNGIISTAPASTPGNYGYAFYNSGNSFYLFENWANEVCHWDVTQVAAQWNHVAWVRSSGVFTFYYNGVAQTKTSTGGAENRNCQQNVIMVGQFYSDGTLPTVYGCNTYIDDVRVTKGVARYTSNFSIPNAQFPDS